MAALNVSAFGHAGFTQAPVDVRGGVPPCGPSEIDASRFRGAERCGPSAPPLRTHDLGSVVDARLEIISDAIALGSCRAPMRPSVVHMGDEIGGFNNARWRSQFAELADVLSTRRARGGEATRVALSYRPSPFHYWRVCAVDPRDARPPAPPAATRPSPGALKFTVNGEIRNVTVDLCDDPRTVGVDFCGSLGLPRADGEPCVEKVAAQASQVRDALWDHRRPEALELHLMNDDSVVDVSIVPGDDPAAVARSYCRDFAIADSDCLVLAEALRAKLPPHARAWCQREHAPPD